nr:hypothetical protein BaRGS_027352 [Batillaria attramentaria]
MQSPRIQCCLCAFSVFSALFGMFMMSAGVCLILNYNFMEVDTSGLPEHLHNEEGKKVVGIILLCVGLGALGLSALVTTLYFTACTRTNSPQSSVRPEGGSGGSDRPLQNGGHPARHSRSSEGHNGHHHGHHHHGNGATPGRASPAPNGGGPPSSRRTGSVGSLRRAAMASGTKRAGSLPSLGTDGPSYTQRMHSSRSGVSTPPSARSGHHKSRKKMSRHAHQGRFQNPLTAHPEEEEQSLSESRRSSGKRRSIGTSPERDRGGGRVNYGADLNDDTVLIRDPSNYSESSTPTPPVIIQVDTTHLENDVYNDESSSENCLLEAGLSRETTQFSDEVLDHVDNVDNVVYRVTPREYNTNDLDDLESGVKDRADGEGEEEEEEEESGRGSRSTDSLDNSEAGVEGSDEAKKRLEERIQQLIQ